jgi:hypothetical protein
MPYVQYGILEFEVTGSTLSGLLLIVNLLYNSNYFGNSAAPSFFSKAP